MTYEVEIPEEFITELKKEAETFTVEDFPEEDEWIPADMGNTDDVFWAGIQAGETRLARRILNELKVPFIIPKE